MYTDPDPDSDQMVQTWGNQIAVLYNQNRMQSVVGINLEWWLRSSLSEEEGQVAELASIDSFGPSLEPLETRRSVLASMSVQMWLLHPIRCFRLTQTSFSPSETFSVDADGSRSSTSQILSL